MQALRQKEGSASPEGDFSKNAESPGEATPYTPARIERVAAGTMSVYKEKPTDKDPGKAIERLARGGRRFADVPFEIQ
jgi:hypothetical protein